MSVQCKECGAPMVRLVGAPRPGMGGSGEDFIPLVHTVGGIDCLRNQVTIGHIHCKQYKSERDLAEERAEKAWEKVQAVLLHGTGNAEPKKLKKRARVRPAGSE